VSAAGRHAGSGMLRAPLLVKEIRTRLRARTVVISGNLYVLALCTVVLLGLLGGGSVGEALGWQIGSSLFKTLTYTQALLMLFVSPLVAASAVTGEVEQKTWDSLRAAPVTPRKIIAAKLSAATGVFLMLIFVSLPVASISFILGGVAPVDLLVVYSYTVFCTLTVGAMGLYWSTRFERSIASIPAATVTAVLVLIVSSPASEMNLRSLAMICPTEFLSATYSDAPVAFFGLECPPWVPALALLAALFACLVIASVTRLADERRRRHALRRAALLVLLALVAVFSAGEQVTADLTEPAARQAVGSIATQLLVVWMAAALWIGSSVPVTLGEPRRGPGRILTAPAGYVLLIFAACAPAVVASLIVCRAGAGLWRSSFLVFAGPAFMSSLTWALLARWLAGNSGSMRRFVGLACASVLALVIVVAPFAVLSAMADASENGEPAAVQFASLLSPLTAIWHSTGAGMYVRNLKAVTGLLGKDGPALATGAIFMASALALLARDIAAGRRPAPRGTGPA